MSVELDIASLANALQEAAAVEILPRFRNLGEGDVRVKTKRSIWSRRPTRRRSV